jgi:autotransporter-associated beta strand protein
MKLYSKLNGFIIALALALVPVMGSSALYYWDINGPTAGPGSATPSGTWDGADSNTNWNPNADGTGTSIKDPTTGDDLVFCSSNSASEYASGKYTITLGASGANARSLTFKDGAATLTNGTITLAATAFITNTVNGMIASAIAGAGTNLTKVGAGTLTLTATNSYSGATTVSAGTLMVNGGGITNTASMTLNGTGTSLILTNGASLFSTNTSTIGSGANGNTVFIVSNSLWNAGAKIVYIGSAATTTSNSLTVADGGILTNVVVDFVGAYGNLVITNGGKVLAGPVAATWAGFLGDGSNSNSNRVYVGSSTGSKSVWDLAGKTISLGRSTSVQGNGLVVDAGGFVTNGSIRVGDGNYNNGNYLIITNGGYVQASIAVYVGAAVGSYGTSNYVVIAGTDASGQRATLKGNLNVGNNPYATGNWARVEAGGVVTNTTIVVGTHTPNINNCLIITNGGQVFSSAVGTVGAVSGANSNSVIIAGACGTTNALWDLGGYALTVGGSNAVGNYVRVKDGGQLYCAALNMGAGGLASSNTVNVTAGGLLQCSSVTMGNATWPGSGNSLMIDGGILQFTTATSAITNNNSDAVASRVIMNNGTLSYRLSSGVVDLTNNWIGGGSGIGGTNVAWMGINSLRINNCTATNTLADPYIFCNNRGATNYNGLELFGTAAIKGQGVVIGDGDPAHGGSLLVSGGTATISGVMTNNSAGFRFANMAGLVASNGVVWMSGSVAMTTAGLAVSSAYTTNILAGGTVTWAQLAGTTQRVDGIVAGSGKLVKDGAGVLILAATNTFNGGVTVSGGTLAINGSVTGAVIVGSACALQLNGRVYGTLSVATEGAISGAGTVSGAVTNGGLWNAAITNSTGGATLFLAPSLTIQAGARLNVSGTDFLTSSSSTYTIICATNGGIHGAFNSANLPKGWILDYSPGYVRIKQGYPVTVVEVE